MDIFNVIPDNFFSLLSNPNKATYVGAILEAFKVYEDGSILGIEKKIVVEVITDYLATANFNSAIEDIEVTDGKEASYREKANYILRKMEECGWIDIDVTNDYVELLNFRDYAITICEALLQIQPIYDDYGEAASNSSEYRGYIYTIYSLLTKSDIMEYGIVMDQVYRNTKLFIRELRKLDSRLKDYIKKIIDQSEIKDLMDLLMNYKVELVDTSYGRLKMSDNVNKYRLAIVKRLEEFVSDNDIVEAIALNYRERYHNPDDCIQRALRDLNEVIYIFEELDDMIDEIDTKNRTYINSTIGKIEFLLKEDNNITGKINTILKHISNQKKVGKIDSAINMVQPIFKLKSFRSLEETSLYQPRAPYVKNQPDRLLQEPFDITEIESEFFKAYQNAYGEADVLKFVDDNMKDGLLKASEVMPDNPTIDDLLMVIYALIYAASDIENRYRVDRLDNMVEKGNYRFFDFIIERTEEK